MIFVQVELVEVMAAKVLEYVRHEGEDLVLKLEFHQYKHDGFHVIDNSTGEILLTVSGESIHYKEWDSFVKSIKELK